MIIDNYLIFAILSVFLYALTTIFQKFKLGNFGGPIPFFALTLHFGLPVLIIINYFDNTLEYTTVSPYLLTILLSSIFSFIGFLSLLTGIERGNASVGGILLSSRIIFTIPLAYFVIGERYGVIVYLLIFLAAIGSVVVSWEVGMNFRQLLNLEGAGIRWFFVTSLFWSISNFLIRTIPEVPATSFILTRQIFFILLIYPTYFITTRKFNFRRVIINKSNIKDVFIYIIILTTAQIWFTDALSINLTITETIGIMEGAITLIFSLIIAKFISNDKLQEPLDKKSIQIKIVGTILVLVGTIGATIVI